MLYGLHPSPTTNKGKINLWPAMTLKARVSYVKEVGPGESLSYGRTYITTQRQRIATLPIGYADGLSRLLSNKVKFLIHGQNVPVVGQSGGVWITRYFYGDEFCDKFVIISCIHATCFIG